MSPIMRFVVTPGTAWKLSTPAIIRGKTSRSASITANIRVPRESFGSRCFAVKPTARCPTNIAILSRSKPGFFDAVFLPQQAEALARLAFFIRIPAHAREIVVRDGVNRALHQEFSACLAVVDLPGDAGRAHFQPVRETAATDCAVGGRFRNPLGHGSRQETCELREDETKVCLASLPLPLLRTSLE